jgi:hypothetical protein
MQCLDFYKDRYIRCMQHVPMLLMERLINIVKDKEQRSKKYEKCDAYWLLVIIVDFINSAQDQGIQVDAFKKIKTETFERVIVYKTLFGHVLEASKES